MKMAYQADQKNSGEIYFMLCKNKRNPLVKAKVDDVMLLLEAIQSELLGGCASPFLDACFSAWMRYAQRIQIKDLTYAPLAFRLSYSNEPYAISSNEAYNVFKLSAGDLAGEDISTEAEMWLVKYLGKKFDYSNPVDHCVDHYLKSIDDCLVQTHQLMLRQLRGRIAARSKDPEANVVLEEAKIEAQAILAQAEKKAQMCVANAESLEREAIRLRREGELAARTIYAQAEAAEKRRTQQAQELLDQAKSDAKRVAEDAVHKAEEMIAQSNLKAEAIVKRAQARANEITQKAAEEKYQEQKADLQEGINSVLNQFVQTQEAMRKLEAQFDQAQLLKIFDTFYSLYDMIDLNRNSLQNLPEEYSYISENMEIFLEIIQEGLADFGIQTIVSAPESPFVGKLHDVYGSTMFDPAKAKIQRSLRPGFVNSVTENVLRKEQVDIICE